VAASDSLWTSLVTDSVESTCFRGEMSQETSFLVSCKCSSWSFCKTGTAGESSALMMASFRGTFSSASLVTDSVESTCFRLELSKETSFLVSCECSSWSFCRTGTEGESSALMLASFRGTFSSADSLSASFNAASKDLFSKLGEFCAEMSSIVISTTSTSRIFLLLSIFELSTNETALVSSFCSSFFSAFFGDEVSKEMMSRSSYSLSVTCC